jgi:hypothetical protein
MRTARPHFKPPISAHVRRARHETKAISWHNWFLYKATWPGQGLRIELAAVLGVGSKLKEQRTNIGRVKLRSVTTYVLQYRASILNTLLVEDLAIFPFLSLGEKRSR